ncbi:hypothetical protein GGI07_001110 [Coemansia sp. Benny D115]|nr:hypothetical protein GGI07_001110 [Coemansia sp. Benny D115]
MAELVQGVKIKYELAVSLPAPVSFPFEAIGDYRPVSRIPKYDFALEKKIMKEIAKQKQNEQYGLLKQAQQQLAMVDLIASRKNRHNKGKGVDRSSIASALPAKDSPLLKPSSEGGVSRLQGSAPVTDSAAKGAGTQVSEGSVPAALPPPQQQRPTSTQPERSHSAAPAVPVTTSAASVAAAVTAAATVTGSLPDAASGASIAPVTASTAATINVAGPSAATVQSSTLEAQPASTSQVASPAVQPASYGSGIQYSQPPANAQYISAIQQQQQQSGRPRPQMQMQMQSPMLQSPYLQRPLMQQQQQQPQQFQQQPQPQPLPQSQPQLQPQSQAIPQAQLQRPYNPVGMQSQSLAQSRPLGFVIPQAQPQAQPQSLPKLHSIQQPPVQQQIGAIPGSAFTQTQVPLNASQAYLPQTQQIGAILPQKPQPASPAISQQTSILSASYGFTQSMSSFPGSSTGWSASPRKEASEPAHPALPPKPEEWKALAFGSASSSGGLPAAASSASGPALPARIQNQNQNQTQHPSTGQSPPAIPPKPFMDFSEFDYAPDDLSGLGSSNQTGHVEQLNILLSMGFSHPQAIHALEMYDYDVNKASNYLIDKSFQ